MEWPAPIEHVWDALGRCIARLNPPPQTLTTLATALREQWLSLSTELIDRIIDSITHRWMGIWNSKGCQTRVKWFKVQRQEEEMCGVMLCIQGAAEFDREIQKGDNRHQEDEKLP
ncbi:hypothetical protein AVEN_159895-1 [Araneus ventricosus]|uniref:Uncharacterized protein n=1 Tax=Araneus ventricosus TaxID=182803 RepID=A0A4Y2E4J1_ARAVE|nr:hypothetical protein AVEN_159895-1 [Araneus ventricosus]